MNLKIYPNSTNYTCQVIALPNKQAIPGLDNLVGVNVQGNTCLIGKDSSVIEEGFCIRIDKYPKPEIFKIKSKQFLLHEGNLADKEEVNIEDEQT